MRIGLLIYGSLETISGGYLYDRMLVEHLCRAGDEVEVVSLPWRDYARHLGDNLSAAFLRRLERLDVEALLQDELNHPSLFWLNWRLKGRLKYPILSIVHHLRSRELRPAWQNHLYRQVERRYLRSVEGFIYNSHTTRREVEALLPAPRPHVVAYPAGDRFSPQVSAEEVAHRAVEPGPLRLLFLGNVIPRKGLHTLLEAISRLPSGWCTLEVVGRLDVDQAYITRIRRQAAALGLLDRVHFAGLLEDAALAERLRTSHVLVVPSSYEGFGIVYLEAMGYGLPAIGGDAGAAGEIITPGENGFLVPPGEAAVLADCLKTLCSDRLHLMRMGQAALLRFRIHPTWEQSAADVRAFIHRVAKEESLRPF